MTKRTVGGMLLGLLVSVTAAIASCSFPTYEIIVTGTAGSTGGASATSSSGSVGGGGGNGGASTTGTTSSGSGGSSTSTSSSSSTGTGGVCVGDGGACDCDGDKVLAISCGTGTDCNDNDPLVFKGQTKFFKDKIAGSLNDYDYDCSGNEEYKLTTLLSCVGVALCDTTTVGWKGTVPDCGASGQFGTCKVGAGLACVESIQGTQLQTCH